ncbi:transposase [Streptomyces sp. NPDC026665]|uniref:transposase n=1 Tax=Streptomyces sp. NPDC026665 TaxID=3154798 RepID=UPI0033D0E219
MSTSYRAAVRTVLRHATIVVDHFHGVQLVKMTLSTVRRHNTATLRGRRGRATAQSGGRPGADCYTAAKT